LLLGSPDHGVAHGEEIGHELAGRWCQGAALHVLAVDLSLDQLPAKHALGFLDAPPDVAIAFAKVADRMRVTSLSGSKTRAWGSAMSQLTTRRETALRLVPRVKVWLERDGRYAFGFGIAEIL
jgi:hypothetical protein